MMEGSLSKNYMKPVKIKVISVSNLVRKSQPMRDNKKRCIFKIKFAI